MPPSPTLHQYDIPRLSGCCAGVIVDEQERIVQAAPIFRRFVGQPVSNLEQWARRMGGQRVVPEDWPIPLLA